jgi:hypothetical protein
MNFYQITPIFSTAATAAVQSWARAVVLPAANTKAPDTTKRLEMPR